MFKKVLAGVCFLIIAVGLAFAQDGKLEFEGRYWIADLDAEAKAVESNLGAKFDFKSDLGMQDEDFPEGRIIWHTGPNSKLRLAYTQVDYSGDKEVTRTIEFEGQSYTAGTRVKSGLEIQYLRLGWIWQFIDIADGAIKLGPVIEAKGIIADVSLDAPTLNINESEEFLGGLPTAGIALDINPTKKINLFGEISGFHAGDYGYFFDAEAGLKVMPFKNLSIVAGYRIIDINAEDDPDFLEMQIEGPFVGGTLRF